MEEGLFSGRERYAVGAAFVLVGLSLCVYAVSWVKPKADPRLVDGSLGVKPAPKPAPAPFGPSEFQALLATQRNRSTERFAADFLAADELRGAWEAYLKSGDLLALSTALRSKRRFYELLERYSSDKRFESAADAVMADPRVAPAAAGFGRL